MKDALDFAEKMAEFELKRIDRIHIRFLWFVGSAVTLVLAVLTVLGFIGYNNMRAMATSAAEDQLRTEVANQIKAKLSKENLPEIVQNEIHTYAKNELQSQIVEQINNGPLHQRILEVGRQETATLAKTLLTPRTLRPDDATRIVNAINADEKLKGQVYAIAWGMNGLETDLYERQVSNALQKTQLTYDAKLAVEIDSAGVTIYFNEGQDRIHAEHLADAFKAGHIKAKVEPKVLYYQNEPAKDSKALVIGIGPNYLR